jgi:hypothetical protein
MPDLTRDRPAIAAAEDLDNQDSEFYRDRVIHESLVHLVQLIREVERAFREFERWKLVTHHEDLGLEETIGGEFDVLKVGDDLP